VSKESANQFDQLGALYEDLATWPFREHIETPSVKHALGSLAGLDVVDYGCGSGFYARTIKAEGARRVVGYDLADGMLEYARRVAERDGVPIEFRSRLGPECEGAFDVVLAVYVLPYATTRAELDQMCAEMMAPLRPGGRLIALPIHARFEPDPDYYAACGFTLTPDDPQHPYEEGGRLRLDLRYRQYDASVYAWYWSEDAISAALGKAGATAIRWANPALDERYGAAEVPQALQAYVEKPHASILQCRKS